MIQPHLRHAPTLLTTTARALTGPPPLQRNLALPRPLSQTQGLDAVLPTRPTTFPATQILQQLLAAVHQQAQIALVVLVALAAGGEEVGDGVDLGG
ncbi:hypothetical protein OPT61_g10571 [Boeremia exigua]|uniref:Uncharacterized protein n=1 Tax=Boeremia exigua TaxID=749465 RepID=A0ACC2HP03_9PLEO|nr:hypothetical protein OPT61_g10571 [Boeremia exigua]